jgi:pimeloyl-ACP methyl ester carboxylesterase
MHAASDFVFVHGGGQGGWVWEKTIAALARQTNGGFGRALALDAPGCGTKRARSGDVLDNLAIAHEFVHEIEAAGMTDVILVGHSQAGNILPFIAESKPELIRRFVYVSCSIPSPQQSVREMMGSGEHGSDPDQVGWPRDFVAMNDIERIALLFCNDMTGDERSAFQARLGEDHWPAPTYSFRDWRTDHLRDVRGTYVKCLRDVILPIEWQDVFAKRLAVDRIVSIDAGHQAMISRPHALAEIIRHEAIVDGEGGLIPFIPGMP